MVWSSVTPTLPLRSLLPVLKNLCSLPFRNCYLGTSIEKVAEGPFRPETLSSFPVFANVDLIKRLSRKRL